jgi:L,D-peptidoglycan transpeptidase YkuD (ErfK/YbiS/YcfS/YnhG family)
MRKAIGWTIGALLTVYAVTLVGASLWAHTARPARPCPSSGAVVQVDTSTHVLCLCRNGQVEGRFLSTLGRGGVDKRQEGDGRTPLGRYSLAAARPSSRYHLFLPVGYPTEAQRLRGFSGSAIGLHGPHVAFAWLRHATLWVDWTQGCIAVATASEVEQIARWVRQVGATEILIL